MTNIPAVYDVAYYQPGTVVLKVERLCKDHTASARELYKVQTVAEIPPRKAWEGVVRCSACMARRIDMTQCVDCGEFLDHQRVQFFARTGQDRRLRPIPNAFQCLSCATRPRQVNR